MGEASLFLAKQVNPKATPYRRGEDDLKVTYLVFPGTAKKPFGPPNLEEWRALCMQYLNELGGIGAGFEVHTWEDKFKKPEVVMAPAIAADSFVGPPAPTSLAPAPAKDKVIEPAPPPADKPAGSRGAKRKRELSDLRTTYFTASFTGAPSPS